ncbi:MAG TPA: AAA family ATPase [Acidimicrobiia bacterium]|nr:AAA family ATPase [Acidimicrobiia bacterium]
MKCPACGAANLSDHKHCSACGARLEGACPGCGKVNPVAHRYCSECGEVLAFSSAPESPKPPRGEERRFVTALFADLVGFTPLTESTDAEEVRRLLTRYFDRARGIIERFGGEVDKFIGDAITAFWGARVSHEDDAERAVRAGLELVDAVATLGEELRVPALAARVGILSGETAVGPGGNQQGLIVGDIVNTAARLQTVASPGTVVVGDSTRRLTADTIEYVSLDPQILKGKTSPVIAWQAVGLLSARRTRIHGHEGPFVGRQEELRLLKDQLSVAARERRPRLVSIVGEGGIGKSRLLWELETYASGLAESIHWLEGRSPAYGEGVTFWALGEMVRQLAGVAETADAATSLTRLRATLFDYVLDDEDRRWIGPRLEGLLGLAPVPLGGKDELYAALRMFIQRIAEQGTTVLVFEDLQWADPGLIDFIEQLVERSPRNPLLVITLARPALLDRHPGWGAGKPNHLSTYLGPLAEADIAELVRALTSDLADEDVKRIAEASGGIPLYAVELVRTWVAAGGPQRDRSATAGGLVIPDSLQSVIGARLDLLDPADRSLLQQASILGQTFTIDALLALASGEALVAEVVNASLDRLVRAEMLAVDDDPTSPERGQYRFIQELIREVAYGRLTRADRRSKHLAAAIYMQAWDDPELAPVIASHYLRAYQADPERSPELAEQGLVALTSAAARAADLHSHRQALNLYKQAAALTDDPARIGVVLERALDSARAAGDVDLVAAVAGDAVDAYRRAGDVQGTARVLTVQAESLCDEYRPQQAMDLLVTIEGWDLDRPTWVRFVAAKARASFMTEQNDAAIELSDQIMSDLEASDDREVLIHQLITKGSALLGMGRDTEGFILLEGALRRAEEWALGWPAGRARNNLLAFLQLDNPVRAGPLAEEGYEAAQRYGDQVGMGRLGTWVIWDRIGRGQLTEAEAVMRELDDSAISSSDAKDLEAAKLSTRALRGDDQALVELLRLAEQSSSDPNPGLRDWGRWRAARSHRLAGRPVEAYETLIGFETEESREWGFSTAALTALWAGDLDRIRFLQREYPFAGRRGRRFVGYRLLLEAGEAALTGRAAEAGAAFRQLIDLWEGVMLPDEVNEVRVLYAATVPGDPAAQQESEIALRWIEESGATHLFTTWQAGLPSMESSPVLAAVWPQNRPEPEGR